MVEQGIYTIGGTVQAGGGLYIPRAADAELLGLCRAATFAYVLAPRQMGKSSLMLCTAEQLAGEGIRSVIIDLTSIGVQVTAEKWYLGLLFAIKRQLKLKTDVVAWWQTQAELGMIQRLTLFFQEVLLAEVVTPVVIFVDEIDTTLSLGFTDDFYAAIRYLYNARAQAPEFQRLSFVLIGVATPGDLIRDPQRTPFNIGQRVDLTDFTFEEARPLAEGLGLPPGEAEEVLGWVLEWTGGHPYLTQRLCRAIIDQGRSDWSEADVDRMVASTFFGMMSEQDNNLQFVRDMLTRRAPDRGGVLTTYREIRRGRTVPDEEQSLVKSHLKLSGVVLREHGALRVRNPIYGEVFDERWVREHLPPAYWTKQLQRALRLIVILLVAVVAAISLAAYALSQRAQAIEQATAAQTSEARAVAAQATAEAGQRAAQTAQAEAVAAQARSERQRQAAEAQALAFRAQTIDDPELSLLIAMEAARRVQHGQIDDANAQIEDALRSVIRDSHLYTTMRGHTAPVVSLGFGPDGRLLVTVSKDGTARLWDTSTGKELMVLRGHTKPVTSATFSPDGHLILTTSEDHTARIWDLSDGKGLIVLGGDTHTVRAAAWSPDSKRIVTTSPDGTARVWDVQTGKELAVMRGHTEAVNQAAFSSDGRFIITASSFQDGTLRIWDAQAGKQQRLIRLGEGKTALTNATFSADSKLALVVSSTLFAGSDGIVRVVDMTTGAELVQMSHDVVAAAFSPDSASVVTANDDGTARIWAARTGQEHIVLRGHADRVFSAAFSPDGQFVVTASFDGTARVWQVSTGKELAVLRGLTNVDVFDLAYAGPAVAFSPDNRFVAVVGSKDTAQIWDAATGRARMVLDGHVHDKFSAAFSPDGKAVIAGTRNGPVQVWNASTGKARDITPDNRVFASLDHRFVVTLDQNRMAWAWDAGTGRQLGVFDLRDYTGDIDTLAYIPEGRLRLVTTTQGGTARVWEVGKNQALTVLGQHTPYLYHATLSPNGQFAIISEQNRTRIWAIESGRMLLDVPELIATPSGDGRFLFTASGDGKTLVWDLAAGQVRLTLQNNLISWVSFSPESSMIITWLGVPRGLDAQSERELVVLRGHTGGVSSAAFSPDGRFVVTASTDGTARVWKTSTGKELFVLRGAGPMTSAAFSPDGKLIVTTSDDGTARIYACDVCGSLDDLLALAHTRVARELTCEERQTILGGNVTCPTPTPTPAPAESASTPTSTLASGAESPTSVGTPTPAPTPPRSSASTPTPTR